MKVNKSKLIINPVGGLANRMRAIASGITLARELNVDYSIVWHVNEELFAQFEDVFEDVHEISGHIAYPGSAAYAIFYSVPRKKNLYITKLTWLRYGLALYDGMGAMQVENVVLHEAKNCIAQGRDCFIQSGCEFYPFANELYRHLFSPAREISKNIFTDDNMVGLHIRRTDNAESIKHSPDELFIDKINEIRQRNPSVKFYLATDDAPTKERFKTEFGEAIITDNSPVERHTKAGITNAVKEMFTLASCAQIIGSHYSSYSEAAALLGDTPLTQLRR